MGSLFIVKIVRAKPEGVEIGSWLEMMFGLHEREIIQYQSNRAFVVPGFYKPVPHLRIAGSKIPRTVPQGQRVWLRFDRKYPNAIDLEAPIAHGNEPRIFQITRDDWNHLKMWLDPVNKTDHAFHEKDCQQFKVIQHRNAQNQPTEV